MYNSSDLWNASLPAKWNYHKEFGSQNNVSDQQLDINEQKNQRQLKKIVFRGLPNTKIKKKQIKQKTKDTNTTIEPNMLRSC